jgi:hypothetical protein
MSMYWKPSPVWQGQAAYLIGGGSSLQGFDFSLLRGRACVGANHAFELGGDIVPYTVFADADWFHKVQYEIKEKYTGKMVSLAPAINDSNYPWIHKMQRQKERLGFDDTLGWNYSSGAIAMNLALSLGAGQLYLLGYDLAASPKGKTHWHARYAGASNPDTFARFNKGFKAVKDGMAARYPDVRVYNVTDGQSNLKLWPRISFASFVGMLRCNPLKEAA